MTRLFCTGTLFSGWQHSVERQLPVSSENFPAYKDLSAFNAQICHQHFPVTDEFNWRPFSPDEECLETARSLLSAINEQTVFIWADDNSSLLLDFWHTLARDSRFVLFYSSPEYELSKYLNTHPYDAVTITRVIDAWLIRTRSMLTFFMRHRGECLLLNVQSTQSQNGLLIQTLNEKFDLGFESAACADEEQLKNSALLEYLATSLLLDDETVAEVYDELRSVATVVCEQDKTITEIQSRNKSLITGFLQESSSYKQLVQTHKALEDELCMKQLQINQITEESEFYFTKADEQEKMVATFTDYLSDNALLKVARQLRTKQ